MTTKKRNQFLEQVKLNNDNILIIQFFLSGFFYIKQLLVDGLVRPCWKTEFTHLERILILLNKCAVKVGENLSV
jgi:hypothetical protein